MRSGTFLKLLCGSTMAVALGLSATSHAAFSDIQTWNFPTGVSDVDGWTGGSQYPQYNTGSTNPYMTDGGADAGSLGIRTDDYPNGSVWGPYLPAIYAGDWEAKFGATGNITFDIKVWQGANATPAGNAPDGFAWGQDAGANTYSIITTGSYFNLYRPSYAGWRFPFNPTTQGAGAGTVTRTIPFDANWTDGQALAAGWVASEYGADDWQATVADVAAGPQSGFKINAGGYSMHYAIDNFRPGPIVLPEPGSALLLLSLGGLLAGRSRRKA